MVTQALAANGMLDKCPPFFMSTHTKGGSQAPKCISPAVGWKSSKMQPNRIIQKREGILYRTSTRAWRGIGANACLQKIVVSDPVT